MEKNLNVKKSLSLLQHSGYMMQVPSYDQIQLDQISTLNDRVVKAFFTQQNDLIQVYRHGKEILFEDKSINSPSNSWYKVVVPLAKNPDLRFKFVRFYTNAVRIGRLLEIMDYIAVTVAYKYAQPRETKKITIVTAVVDNILFFDRMVSDQDLCIQGYVTYAGTSSIEVQIDLSQADPESGKEKLKVSAIFLMVARDGEDHKKSAKVPKLIFEHEQDIESAVLRYEIGKKNQDHRKLLASISLLKQAPQTNEINKLHEFFTNKQQFEQNIDYTKINDTKLEKNLLMHIQDKNLHGKIFGGHLMREAFELGWLNAYLHVKGKCYPEIFNIDDIQFLQPIDIGSTLSIASKVTFIQDNILHCQVECSKILPDNTKVKTNDLHLTFQLTNSENIKQVYPDTYSEGMMWLDAKRKLQLIS